MTSTAPPASTSVRVVLSVFQETSLRYAFRLLKRCFRDWQISAVRQSPNEQQQGTMAQAMMTSQPTAECDIMGSELRDCYQHAEGAVYTYRDMIDEQLDGGLTDGISEYQFNKTGLSEHYFNVERRRDTRRNMVVHIYILKVEHEFNIAILRQIHDKLIGF